MLTSQTCRWFSALPTSCPMTRAQLWRHLAINNLPCSFVICRVFPLECSFRRLGRPKRVETSCNLTRRANSVQQNLLQNPFLISVFESAPSSQTMISCSSQSTPTILFLPHRMRDLIPWLFNSLRTSSDTTADTSSL